MGQSEGIRWKGDRVKIILWKLDQAKVFGSGIESRYSVEVGQSQSIQLKSDRVKVIQWKWDRVKVFSGSGT